MESSVSGKTKGSRSVARSTPDLLGAPINPIYQPRDRESAGFITKIWPFLKIWFGIETLNFPPVTSNHSQTRNSSIVRPPCFRSLPIILWKLTLVEKPRRSLPFRICVPQWSESQVQSLYDYSCITYCDTYLRKTLFRQSLQIFHSFYCPIQIKTITYFWVIFCKTSLWTLRNCDQYFLTLVEYRYDTAFGTPAISKLTDFLSKRIQ